MKLLLVGLNAKYIHSALSLYSIAAACREAGHTVEVNEYTINQEFLYVLGEVARRSPEVVGIACYVWNREYALKLAAALKKVCPDVRTVFGGPEATGDAAALLRENSSVDFVVQGEGEESMPELLEQIAAGAVPLAVRGVAVRQGGEVLLNGGVRVVEDLDRLPFPYCDDMMPVLEHRIVYYESSRGCPFSCSYCVSSTTVGVRRRSPELVRTELQFFLRHGVRQVKFVDRTFNACPEHYREIWRFLAQSGGTTGFHFEIVADLLEPAEVQWLSRVPAGRFQFEIGVQSTHEPTLQAIGRHGGWERLCRNVGELQRHGNIHLHLDLIAGLPYEDLPHFARSFNAVYGLQPDMLQIGFLKLLPGTPIRRDAAVHGYLWLDHPPYEILADRWLSFGEIRELKVLEEVFNQTYNSGRFNRCLAFLVFLSGGDAFALYRDLSCWWERSGLSGKPSSPDRVLDSLRRYASRFSRGEQACLAELLKFDVLLDPSGTLKGEDLDWDRERWQRQKTALWRDETVLQRYIPGYRFTNWREVKRKYPIECFTRDVFRWIAGEERATEGQGDPGTPCPVLFDLGGRQPEWHVLPPALFGGEGSGAT